jgi:hypothetical protein
MPATTPNPDKAAQRGAPRQDGWTPPTYVSIDLTNEQKSRLSEWVGETEYTDVMAWLQERVVGGHYLSIKPSKGGVMATLTGGTFASGHLNLALTNRASTVEKLLFGLMYRDTEVTGGDWSKATAIADDY